MCEGQAQPVLSLPPSLPLLLASFSLLPPSLPYTPQLLRDMEESYRQRLEAEVAALERKMGGAAATGGWRAGPG